MSFLDSLFSSNQTTTSTNEGYAPAMGVVDQSLGFLQSQPYMQAYGGPYAAAMNPQLNQALNQQPEHRPARLSGPTVTHAVCRRASVPI